MTRIKQAIATMLCIGALAFSGCSTSLSYGDPISKLPYQDYLEQSEGLVREMLDHTVYIHVLKENGKKGSGSGVVISVKYGVILTAAHVVEDCKRVRVVTRSGIEYEPKEIKVYSDYDVALIIIGKKIDASPATLSENTPLIGDTVYVCGSPYGYRHFNSLSKGILSGINRKVGGYPGILYQTDASILPGNSGGPWFDAEGKLIAMTTMWRPLSGDVGFGIPVDTIKNYLTGEYENE